MANRLWNGCPPSRGAAGHRFSRRSAATVVRRRNRAGTSFPVAGSGEGRGRGSARARYREWRQDRCCKAAAGQHGKARTQRNIAVISRPDRLDGVLSMADFHHLIACEPGAALANELALQLRMQTHPGNRRRQRRQQTQRAGRRACSQWYRRSSARPKQAGMISRSYCCASGSSAACRAGHIFSSSRTRAILAARNSVGLSRSTSSSGNSISTAAAVTPC